VQTSFAQKLSAFYAALMKARDNEDELGEYPFDDGLKCNLF